MGSINYTEQKIKIEKLKAISLFVSSIIISLTGTFLTFKYNSNQLDISRNKELSYLLPKLKSLNINEKRQAITALSLYGKDAILPLMSVWTDTAHVSQTNEEVLNSIVMIGDVAIPYLYSAYTNSFEVSQKRQWALLTLIKLDFKNSKELIKEALFSNPFNPDIAGAAILGAGILHYKEMTPRIIEISKAYRDDSNNIYIVENIPTALGYLGGNDAKKEIYNLLINRNPDIRINALFGMQTIADSTDINKLTNIIKKERTPCIKSLGESIIRAIKIKH